ncbi:MAG: hypothetical protein WC140_04540 [Bacteroidales bacterium]
MKNLFRKILRKKKLNKLDENNKPVYKDLFESKTCGFIFNVNEPEIVDSIITLEKILKEHNIKYKGVSINFGTQEPADDKFLSDANILNMNDIDINWYGFPSEDLTKEFINTEFDLLIDFTLDFPSFPIEYLLRASKAKFKIGFYPESEQYYNFYMFPTKEIHPKDIVISICNYLTTIRSSK